MTLSFSQKINGKENFFVEKIWFGLMLHGTFGFAIYDEFRREHYHKYEHNWAKDNDILGKKTYPKLHTLREDKHDRWKAGRMIQAVINNRNPLRFQFAPDFPCKSVQQIEIKKSYCDPYGRNKSHDRFDIYIDDLHVYSNYWYVQDIDHGTFDMLNFARNDGFESIEDFFKYFNDNWSGKIIHFTDLKY